MAKKEILFKGEKYAISYEILNTSKPDVMLFLHGWGSNKELMKQAFSTTFPEYKHIYLDLPGFGASTVHHILDTQDYSQLVTLFLDTLNITPVIILGHSYGGKIATLLKPSKLILASSAGIVAPKSFKLKGRIAIYKCLKPFLPRTFYRFFASKDVDGMKPIMYDILKKVVNEDFTNHFLQTTSQTFIFWGKDDRATPLKSGEIIHSLIHNSTFYPLEGDHFFFMKQGKKMETLFLESGF